MTPPNELFGFALPEPPEWKYLMSVEAIAMAPRASTPRWTDPRRVMSWFEIERARRPEPADTPPSVEADPNPHKRAEAIHLRSARFHDEAAIFWEKRGERRLA